jgi:hypothetical protein
VKKKYRVLALNGWGDTQQGEEVTLDLTEDQAKQATERGELELATKKDKEDNDG